MVLISIILTILVLNCQFRGPKQQRVPKWMRKYIICYLGKFFCFYNESRAYKLKSDRFNNKKDCSIQIDNNKSLTNIQTKSTVSDTQDTESNEDIKNFKGKNLLLNETTVDVPKNLSNFYKTEAFFV